MTCMFIFGQASHTTYAVVYFVLTISLGAFFAMNLFIVVIVRQFSFSKNNEGASRMKVVTALVARRRFLNSYLYFTKVVWWRWSWNDKRVV